ncbi:hypothetical protein [Amycolatopsis sp. cmx-4-54]|uniref:hypothetical protein n=1 Tax=Amycolatopsis sp. cmx-4-54 TaxID=2790936 RepID=UPI00397B49F5
MTGLLGRLVPLPARLRRLRQGQFSEVCRRDQRGLVGGDDARSDSGHEHEVVVSARAGRRCGTEAGVLDRGGRVAFFLVHWARSAEGLAQRGVTGAVGRPSQPHEDRLPVQRDLAEPGEESGQDGGMNVVFVPAEPVGQLCGDWQQHRHRQPDARHRPGAALRARPGDQIGPRRVPGRLGAVRAQQQRAELVQRYRARRQPGDRRTVHAHGIRAGHQPAEGRDSGVEHPAVVGVFIVAAKSEKVWVGTGFR